MHLSQTKIKRLLRNLQLNQTESGNIDGKETLNLKSEGDYASFIRHIAALANTGQTGYLLIGVEDKTWVVKGIATDSPLRDADGIQQQMNQILANRLSPPLSVRYRTYQLNGAVVGVVKVEGKSPPYVISIEDPSYGGAKTKGKASYIYRGAIYVRRGANSVIANRQSEILQVLEGKRDAVGAIISLVFVAALVGSGVGVGASALEFSDPYVAAFLGSIWGLAIGWMFNKRIVETLGRFSASLFGGVVKGVFGPVWGAIIGSWTSYTMIDSILSGETKASDPVLMGLIIGPTVAVLSMLLIAIFVVAAYIALKTIGEIVDFLRQKAV